MVALERVPGWKWDFDSWDESYGILLAFVEAHKRLPKKTEEYQDVNIGTWCYCQQKKYREQSMLECRVDALERVKGWTWGEKRVKTPPSWKDAFELLERFVATQKRLPTAKEEYKNINVGRWCVRQRSNYRNNNMQQERIDAFEQVKGWTWGEKRDLSK